jgi:hypothetical protein
MSHIAQKMTAHKIKFLKLASAHVDEVANSALAGGVGMFGIALTDIATIVTIIAGLLSVVGLGLGIYLKWLQIRAVKQGQVKASEPAKWPEDSPDS